MEFWPHRSFKACSCLAVAAIGLSCQAYAQTATPAGGDAQVARTVGTIKSTQGDSLTLTPDTGAEVTAQLSGSTKILRVPPGEKDLKNATPLQAQDLRPGDRVLVRGQASADGRAIAALSVIVMKQADLSVKQQRDLEDWQKRGVGGLVTAADAAAGTITISSAALSGNRNIVIHTTQTTTVRRYAPDSVKFDDARPAPLDQIKPGDQLRARGARNADGSEVTAEEIVFGSFRNVAGTVLSIDAASNSITVQDIIGKGSVAVKITPDALIKKLPPDIAQRFAARLKGSESEENGQGNGSGQRPVPPTASGSSPQSSHGPGGMQGQGQRAGGPPDLQRFVARLPNSSLADLQKGDAVMIVSTQSADPGTVTAITVLAGVEPILTAAPNRSAMMLSPWTLGGAGGEGETAP
jgi:hypothetical protein